MSDKERVYLSHGGKRLSPASHSVFTQCPRCNSSSMTYRKEGCDTVQCLTCWEQTAADAIKPQTVYTLTIRDDDSMTTKGTLIVAIPGQQPRRYEVDFYLEANATTSEGTMLWNAGTEAGRASHAARFGKPGEPAK